MSSEPTISHPVTSPEQTVTRHDAEGSVPAPLSGRLGDYELLTILGQGGMGVVYRARQISANRMVALKLIRPGREAREDSLRPQAWARLVALPTLAPLSSTVEIRSPGQRVVWPDRIRPFDPEQVVLIDTGFGPRSVQFAQFPGKAGKLHYLTLDRPNQPGALIPLKVQSVDLAQWTVGVLTPPGNQMLLTAYSDGVIERWSLREPRQTGPSLRLPGEFQETTQLGFRTFTTNPEGLNRRVKLSPDGSRLVAPMTTGIYVHDLTELASSVESPFAQPPALWRSSTDGRIRTVSFSSLSQPPDNTMGLSCQDGQTGRLLWQRVLRSGEGFPKLLQIDPTGRFVTALMVGVAGSRTNSRSVALWDLATGQSLPVPADPDVEPVRLFAPASDSPLTRALRYRAPYLLPDSSEASTEPGLRGSAPAGLPFEPVTVQSRGALTQVLGREGQVARLISRVGYLRDLPFLPPITSPPAGMGPIRRILNRPISNLQSLFVLAGSEDRCRLWNLTSGEPLGPEIRHGAPIRDAWLSETGRFDQPGTYLLVHDETDRLQVYDRSTGLPLGKAVQFGPGPVHVHGNTVYTPRGICKLTDPNQPGATAPNLGLALGPIASLVAPSLMPQVRFPQEPAGLILPLVYGLAGRSILVVFGDHAQLHDEFGKPGPVFRQGKIRHAAIAANRILIGPASVKILVTSDGTSVRAWNANTGAAVTEPIPTPGDVVALFGQSEGFATNMEMRIVTRTHVGRWPLNDPKQPINWVQQPAKIRRAEASGTAQLVLEGENGKHWSFLPPQADSPEQDTPLGVTFTPAGHLLIESEFGRLRLIDPATRQLLWHGLGTAPLPAPVADRLVHFSPEGGLILRDLKSAGEVARLPLSAAPWTERSLSPDGQKLLTLRYQTPSDEALSRIKEGTLVPCIARVWNLADGKPLTEEITSPCRPFFTPDSAQLLVAAGAKESLTTHTVDLATGASRPAAPSVRPDWPARLCQAGPPTRARIVHSPDGRYQAVKSPVGKSLRIFDRITGEGLTQDLELQLSMDRPDVTFSPDGRFFVAGGRLWQTVGGQPVSPPLVKEPWDMVPHFDARGLLLAPFVGYQGGQKRVAPKVVDFAIEESNSDLIRRAEVFAGRRIDRTGTVLPLPPEELVPPTQDRAAALAWHQRQTEYARVLKDWPRALAHLDRQGQLGVAAQELVPQFRQTHLERIAEYLNPPNANPQRAYNEYRELFRRDPVAERIDFGSYNAACAALQLAARGPNAARLRSEAATWLEAQLGRLAQSTNRNLVTSTLRHWKQDPDLAGVRGPAINQLPEAERARWQNLWQQVERQLAGANPGG